MVASDFSPLAYDVENTVSERYQAGARQKEVSLCCPTRYEADDLSFLPPEIIEKDYGCGDPTRYVAAGETVLDLGSGAGKNCYIIARKVGASGQVIGVDFNDEMLDLARRYQVEVANQLGYHNTHFVKGKIQDLTLDLESVEAWLKANPIASLEQWRDFERECDRIRDRQPLIATQSIDLVISNCVLNLVQPQDKQQLFQEIYRVLKRGGRAVISDIVCDEAPTAEILQNPNLWSGCIAGSFREDTFLKMFEEAGFYGIEILHRAATPWQVIDGIEFRSMTVRAYKGKDGTCLERKQAIIYKGPWKQVQDDDGHTFCRGERMAVCDKTYHILTQPDSPYAEAIIPVPPDEEIPLEKADQFNCQGKAIRHPKETKGQDYRVTATSEETACCIPGECC
jgi:ubiquinone/menaquinone biosynthesis C-methylase UbiE